MRDKLTWWAAVWLCAVGASAAPVVPARPATIETVIGGWFKDGTVATQTPLLYPAGVVANRAGDVFVSDTHAGRVLRIEGRSGRVFTVAGNGTSSFSGDGGDARRAGLNYPMGLALSPSGDLYVADSRNERIRKVDLQRGTIETVAGGGSDEKDDRIATCVKLTTPESLAFDFAGNLYIAETWAHRVRRLSARDGTISTVAGTGQRTSAGDGGAAIAADIETPSGLAADRDEILYISTGLRVRSVNLRTGRIETVLGSESTHGLTMEKERINPSAIGISTDHRLFLLDRLLGRVFSIDLEASRIEFLAGGCRDCDTDNSQPAAGVSFNYPMALSFDVDGNVLVADTGSGLIRRVDRASRTVTTIAGTAQASAVPGDSLIRPAAIAFDTRGNLYIADTGHYRVVRRDARTHRVTPFAGSGWRGFGGDGEPAQHARLDEIVGLAATADTLSIAANNRIREARFASGILSTIAGNGLDDGAVRDGMAAREAPFHRVTGVGIGAPQTILIGEGETGRIWAVDPPGLSLRLMVGDRDGRAAANSRAQIRPKSISALVMDAHQNFYVADARGHRVFRAARGERDLTPFAGTGATGADHLLGTYSGDGGSAASAGLSAPSALAVDGAGNLYIADTGNNRVRMVAAATGVISTVAGDGVARWAGDGGPATTASLNHPGGIALDRGGNIYVADTGNNRIRRIVRRLR